MKRKIYWNICLAALFSMVLSVLIAAWLLSRDMQTQMRQAVATEVRYLESAMEAADGDFLDHLASRGDGNDVNRITWVDTDGSVLYDSYADSESLKNHADRPEIREAFEHGRGQSVRISDTLAEQTYYCAARLENGTVIRVASTTRSALAAMMDTIPLMGLLAAVIFGATMVLAEFQTRKIVEPINQIDLDDPQHEQVYDELSLLVRRLVKQKETIRQQMDTLREKQEEFTAITENMREGFIIVDSRADVISYNSSALRILGVELSAEQGENVNVLSFNRSGSFRQVVDQALDGERSEQNLELNGRFYQIIANPVEESGKRNGAVVVILDVTEQQGREELRREFTANVSHELKTPLTSISGYAEIMKDGLVQPADMQRFSEKIYQEAQRLITLVGDIIKLSQLDEGNVGLSRSAVDLREVVSDVLSRLRDNARKNQIDLVIKGGHAIVQGTPQILDEMIFNLCDNAIKYNKQGGWVMITVASENGSPTLTVEDTGIGIAESDQERIFERFYRVDKSHSKQIGGTGLGLSIVKHGAIYHKAKVEMESTLGKGTRIRLIFPKANRER